jgi:hypothetical protein
MDRPLAEIRYSGELRVRPYRRGTYLGEHHLEEMIEAALGSHYSFGDGWRGKAEVTIRFFETRRREDAA